MTNRHRLLASSVALAALCLAGAPAQAQNWDVATAFGGTASAPVLSSGWSAVTRDGNPICNATPALPLPNAFSLGTLRGWNGNNGNQPLVEHNYGAAYTTAGATFQPGDTALHPGPANDCGILRLTIPAGQSGTYLITAGFRSIDANMPSYDGVNAMVLVKGALVGSIVDTQRGAGKVEHQAVLCPGDTVDFAVQQKKHHFTDTTAVAGSVRRTGAAPVVACLKDPVSTGLGGGGGVDPRDFQVVVDVPKDTMVGASPCCAPWSEQNIAPALVPTFANAATPFTLAYQPQALTGAQMAAYLNYIHAMDPTITEITLNWQAVDVGTSPGMSGAPIGTSQTVKWTWANGNVTMSGGNFWGSQTFPINRWIRIWTSLSHNGTPDSAFFGKDCIDNSIAMSWGVVAKIGQSDSGTVTVSSVNGRGRIVKSRPVEMRFGRPLKPIEIPRDD